MSAETIEAWIGDTAYSLIGGQRFLLRLPPHAGKTFLARQLEIALSGSCVFVDGNSFTESNQASKRDEIETGLARALNDHGAAQIIFDSYDRSLTKSQGARLQAWLTSRLIDGKYSRDIGAIFTARCSTEIHRGGAGSPLISRVIPIDPPSATNAVSGPGEPRVREWFGNSTLLAEQSRTPTGFDPPSVADRLELSYSYLDDVRKASNFDLTSRRFDPELISYSARAAAHGLFDGTNATKLFDRLEPLLSAGPVENPAWPESESESVSKFLQLIGTASEILWSDRYIFRDIEPLRSFLRKVVEISGCRIQVLGSREVNGRTISRSETARVTLLPGVDARFMTASDYRDLHDRHLVTGAGGWVLPQAHVIVGRQSPGSTVAAPAASFGVDYPTIWRRSEIP